MELCAVKALNVWIVLDWFDFVVNLVLAKTRVSQKSRPKGPPVTAVGRLSQTNSRPLATNDPEKLTAGNLFGVVEGMYKLAVSSCTGILIAKDKELIYEKLGLRSTWLFFVFTFNNVQRYEIHCLVSRRLSCYSLTTWLHLVLFGLCYSVVLPFRKRKSMPYFFS